jgi:hypothetical protein
MSGEGGGPNPPYKESFLENIVGVGWGGSGGVFISGDFCCFQRYTKLEDNKSMDFGWFGLGSMAFGDLGGTESSTYAKTPWGPVFLIGGHRGGEYDANILMRSTDGYKWDSQGVGGVIFTDNLVWDEDERRFYAGDSDGYYCSYSSDGVYWYISGTEFHTHCKGIMTGTPDGVYGYDKRHDLLIYPDQGEAWAVVNASRGDAESFPVWVGIDAVFTIAYVGGIWMAGGGMDTSMTTCSLDGGNFWFYSTVGDLDMNGDYAVTTMVGAPIKDFRNRKTTAPSTYQKAQTGTAVTPPLVSATASLIPVGPAPLIGVQNASGSQRTKFGTLASAIAPSSRPRARLRKTFRHI